MRMRVYGGRGDVHKIQSNTMVYDQHGGRGLAGHGAGRWAGRGCVRRRPANPESLLRAMEDISKSSMPRAFDLEIVDLYEMTGQAGDADKVLPTLVRANPKL